MARNRKLREEWIADFSKEFVRERDDMRAQDILAELLRHGMGNDTKIRHHLLLADYQTMLQSNGSVMDTIYQLADKYNMSDRQIQNVIYSWIKERKSVNCPRLKRG